MILLSLLQSGGHQIINPFGQIVSVSQQTLRALDMRGYLHRDAATGLKGMDPGQYGIFVDIERGTDHFYELGEDCSGPNAVICKCPDCQRNLSDLDKTPLPCRNPLQDDETSQIVREVRARHEQRY